ncbi:MAG: hypothetical protein HF981_01605 [Desulfobacteraceae bacterium]|nr:hypothetical protein [Desulfobacteraceae bacterium]MBC2749056.1 hypothetical protein [Desulfobacteraceae bacterium]
MHFKALTIQEKQKIKEFLISIAIKIRMIDDIMRQYDTNIYDHIDNNVGFLKIKSDKKKYNLSVREACNKIIHAKSLTFNYNATKDKIEYLKPIVNFIGKKNKNHWKATIDIYKFVEQAVYFSNEYDENWSISGYD